MIDRYDRSIDMIDRYDRSIDMIDRYDMIICHLPFIWILSQQFFADEFNIL